MDHSFIRRFACVTACVLFLPPSLASAHPVPRKAHDRTIDIRCDANGVIVRYRLEVDELTVVSDDLPAIDDRVDLTKLKTPDQFYDAFTRGYAPILADHLSATLDGKPLRFRCEKQRHTLREVDGKLLDHVRFDFVFRADWQPSGDERHTFTFREGNYELEAGMIRLTLEAAPPLEILEKTVAPKELQERASRELKPGEESKLRQAAATFRLPAGVVATTPPAAEATASGPEHLDDDHGLFALLFDTSRGLWLLLLLAAVFGAAHALTPGHGKTLVAAYLVGERGTVWHAFLLGLSTTVSHTGVVIAVTIILVVSGVDITGGLELVAGLVVTVWGFWLLLRRLSGGADHFHFGGHSHGGVWHSHGEGAGPVHSHGGGDAAPVGTWGVIMLGLVGGMVPCTDAIVILVVAIAKQMVSLALPLVLAFSAGLAATLVAVGIGVVYIKGFSESRWGHGKLVRALPLVSAAAIIGVGLWMCYRSVHRA